MNSRCNRRSFLQTSTAAACFAATRGAFPADVNGKLRVAAVGTGNQGGADLREIASSHRCEVATICNVDSSQGHLGWAEEEFPRAKVFRDFRRMLDEPALFDAVLVATPDHMHAPVALAAIQLGKHVYCEKPLAHYVNEARQMRLAAEEQGVVTQMGNQIQSHRYYREAVKLVRDGAIGKVREVHSFHSGDPRWVTAEAIAQAAAPVPPELDWNLWLGVAPERPYKSNLYHPRNWRTWQDFGTGQFGDFGCHILDPVFQALDLTAPVSVEAENEPIGTQLWAQKATVRFRFPGSERTSGDLLPVTWYHGLGHAPNRPETGLPESHELPQSGSILVGESGTLVIPHVGQSKLFPAERFNDFVWPRLADVNHYTSWVDACLDGGTTTSNFSYAGPLTEAVLLGILAMRFPGEQLQWDAVAARITHHADANSHLATTYRSGW